MLQEESFTKTRKPDLPEIFPRERLFSILDGRKSVTWLSAPAGSGKTSLVSSFLDCRGLPFLWYRVDRSDADIASFFYYMGMAAKSAGPEFGESLPLLTPEYLPGFGLFSLRYFEKLSGRLDPPFVLVIDNFQEAPNAEFHAVVAEGLSILPKGIDAILVSRGDPPPEFAKLRASNRMGFLGWNEIRFNQEECGMLAGLGTEPSLNKKLFEKTEGWAAGLVLMSEACRMDSIDCRKLLEEFRPRVVFDYFASEVVDAIDAETRNFLLKTAFVPDMDPEIAEKLSGIENSGEILSRLNRNNFFTERQGESYRYHSLFKDFLRSFARNSLPVCEVEGIRRKSAKVMKESGRTEEAIGLFFELEDWEEAVSLVLCHAPSIMNQGRSRTLLQWLDAIPEEISGEIPWFLYWKGVGEMFFNPPESISCLEKAYHLFRSKDSREGSFLACSGIIDAHIYGWDNTGEALPWADEMEILLEKYGEIPDEIAGQASKSMFEALVYCDPGRARVAVWEERLKDHARSGQDNRFRVMTDISFCTYYFWMGENAKAEALLDELESIFRRESVAPIFRIMKHMFDAVLDWTGAKFDNCEKAVEKGLQIAEESGVHIFDPKLHAQSVYCALLKGEMENASAALVKMSASTNMQNTGDLLHFHYASACHAFCCGDFKEAAEHARISLDLSEKIRFVFTGANSRLMLSHALLHCGAQIDEIVSHVDVASEVAESMKSAYLEFSSGLSYALVFLRQGKKEGLEELRRAFSMGRELGVRNFNTWRREDIEFFCRKALESGIETGYAKDLIGRFGLIPETSVVGWPYPIMIHSKGKFEILKNGKPIEFSGKIQKKPIEMLKTIIELGGREIPEEKLCDILWPDSEGDLAHQSFASTLKRLRCLLGKQETILLRAGMISMNPRYCWIDVMDDQGV